MYVPFWSEKKANEGYVEDLVVLGLIVAMLLDLHFCGV
jgi:hypothetical protein